MVAIYPNIVPENNLRLPDALAIKHGPAPLLARFVVEADKAAREAGLRLRLRHDFAELNRINQQEVKSGNWYPLINMFNPERADIVPENAFWLSGENELGEIVTTFATRIYYWPDTNLEEQAVAMLYGRDEGQRCIITADAAKLISGVVMSSGAAWVRPDYRRRGLSQLLPRIAKAYAVSRWPVDWTFGFVTRVLVEKGVASSSYGTGRYSYSVWFPDLPFGELVVAYTAAREVYEDLAKYLTTALSGSRDEKFACGTLPSGIAHELTKISSDGVFHGNSSRS
jgi:GNAT superfamily N-acetyltransferase